MFTGEMRMDTLLRADVLLAPGATKNPDAYGLEVELEGEHVAEFPAVLHQQWTAVHDHSLRPYKGHPPMEYTFKGPLNLVNTEKAIDSMFGWLTSPGVYVHESYRTSIHVHVNFGCETYRTVYNMICLSLIMDELLVSQNGDHRIGNNFCLRARDAMGQTNSLINSIQQGSEVFGIGQNERYSSINFASLQKFGSIEFRSLECTTHKGRLLHWINTLGYMKKIAKTFTSPIDVISKFSQMGPEEFLYLVLGPYAVKYASVPDMAKMLTHGMRIAQDFAYCSEWKPKKEKTPQTQVLEDAMEMKKATMKQYNPIYPADGGAAPQPYTMDWVLPNGAGGGLGIQQKPKKPAAWMVKPQGGQG